MPDALRDTVHHPAYCQIHFDEALDKAFEHADDSGVRVRRTRNQCRVCGNDGIYYISFASGSGRNIPGSYTVPKRTNSLQQPANPAIEDVT